jgi:histidinol-phosphate aminotransferase
MSLSPFLFASERERYRAEGLILLNSNENAYGPPASAQKAMMNVLQNTHRYPDECLTNFKKQIADFWSVGQENVLLGAGSSEFLGLVSLLVASSNGSIVTAEPSYRVWNGQAEAMGLRFKRIPLSADKKPDLAAMLSAIDKQTRLVYVCNPNNPTGTYVEDHLLRNFVTECSRHCMVLVDEAYTEYAGLSSLKELAISNPNIVVAKTFSKIYGLAGARIGYIIAHADTINKIAALQPWPDANVSVATAAAAAAALADQDFVTDCREKTAQARQLCYRYFRQLSLDFIPSYTNFILFNIDKIAGDFSRRMEEKNILVQYRSHFGGKWCRVSMGTLDEMQTFCTALDSISG